jgi:hypothetical protein
LQLLSFKSFYWLICELIINLTPFFSLLLTNHLQTMFLAVLLCAMSMASADSGSSSAEAASSAPQPATNPANVVFRTVQSAQPVAFSAPATRQYVLAAPQPQYQSARPFAFFNSAAVPQQQFVRVLQQPAVVAQPIVTKFVQPVAQPVLTRTVIQPAPLSVAVKAAEPEPFDANPQYSYGYEINAAESSVYSGHKETRENGAVTGEYRVLDPNGDLRITRYRADENGYNAEVEIQKNAGPVYQHNVARSEPVQIATRPVFRPVALPAAPVDTSAEQKTEVVRTNPGFVDANVLNVRGGQTTFFQAAAPQAQYFQTAAAPQSSSFFVVPQFQQQGARFVAAQPAPQFFAAPNPYSFLRAAAPATVARFAPAPAAQQVSGFNSGASFTRITHSDGTTVEY